MIRNAIHALADNRRFTDWLARRGMNWGFARRFIAGESLDEVLPTVEQLNQKGLSVTLDYLGESVTDEEATRAAAREYGEILDTIAARDAVEASISLKLSQLGQAISDDLATENLRTVVSRAAEHGNFVRIDMEDSSTTQSSIDTLEALHPEFDNLGICLQAYLRRSEQDVRELSAKGVPIRLCKGAYDEPEKVAFQSRSEVDTSFQHLTDILLAEGTYPAFATHDPQMIEHVLEESRRRGIGPDDFEFQMLYGVRRDAQVEIVEDGYRMRIYVPFGTEWCPYFMRRIAERPANALFVARALIKG